MDNQYTVSQHFTLRDIVVNAARVYPDNVVMVHEPDENNSNSITAHELNLLSSRFAYSIFKKYNVKRQEPIGIISPNCLSYFVTYTANSKLATIQANIAYMLAKGELIKVINGLTIRILLVHPSLCEKINEIKDQLETTTEYVVFDNEDFNGEYKEHYDNDSYVKYSDLIKIGVEHEETIQPENNDGRRVAIPFTQTDFPNYNDDVFVLFLTSGTTGLPKAVMKTNKSIIYSLTESGSLIPPGTKIIIYNSLAWVGGTLTAFGMLYSGNCTILLNGYERNFYLSRVLKYKAKMLFFMPSTMLDFTEIPEETRNEIKSFLVAVFYGGGPVNLEVLLTFIKQWDVPNKLMLIQGYGSSESCGVSTLTPEDHRIVYDSENENEYDKKYLKRLTSAGKISLKCDIRILDDDGKEVDRNVIGNIAVRSPFNMVGYYNNNPATDKSIINSVNGRYLLMGDLGYIDEDNYLFVKGRSSETINLNMGFNVFPRELEDVLQGYQEVVQDCAVAGVPHPEDIKKGYVVAAFVVVKDKSLIDTEEKSDQLKQNIKDYFKGKLADYKHPSICVFIDELPKSIQQKKVRRLLRQQYESNLNNNNNNNNQ
eukprot:TRINITY_DN4707_c0_g2_i1.p1 TRINITY_DN4707_c0_g2~~TRINITY_DN4707_c0_g2_i1.p1  ORF type:complete len:596 (-),score=193.84 TRINITY_DN4707_c0_g2_i1:125-1912(-)